MIYNEIDGKQITEHDFESLKKYFANEAFYVFVEEGRNGLKRIAADIVDNLEANLSYRIIDCKGKQLNREEHAEAVRKVTAVMLDGFVRKGSEGLISAFYSAHSLVSDALRNAKSCS